MFRAHRTEFGSFFAYHGSPGQNFHSIIHRGLRSSLNVRSTYGPGTYLTSCIDTAISASKQYDFDEYNRFDDFIQYCVAIVEVIKHPSIKVIDRSVGYTSDCGIIPLEESELSDQSKFDDTSSEQNRYYVVNSNELMRLKYLLVFYCSTGHTHFDTHLQAASFDETSSNGTIF